MSDPADEWSLVSIAGEGIELYITGEDGSVSPNGKQVHVRISERRGHILLGQLQEKLEMRRKLRALQSAQTLAGDTP